MRIVVRATVDGGEQVDILIPFDDDATAAMTATRAAWRAGKSRR